MIHFVVNELWFYKDARRCVNRLKSFVFRVTSCEFNPNPKFCNQSCGAALDKSAANRIEGALRPTKEEPG
jgi:hypothetical protein